MAYTFDGPNKLIILTTGTTVVDVKDLYSRWKEWVATDVNSKYLPAISVLGGDPLPGGRYLGTTYFIENGWKLRPQEANHTLFISGNMYARDGSDPFVNTLGAYNVRIMVTVSNLVDTVATGSGVGTVQQVKDAVWGANNLTAYGVGSAGEKLDSVGAAANPWNTDLSTYTTANTAGKILKDAGVDTAITKTQTDTVEITLTSLQSSLASIPVDVRTEMDTNSVKLAQIKAIIESMTIPTAVENAAAIWSTPIATQTDKTTIGGYIRKTLLTIPAFLGLK